MIVAYQKQKKKSRERRKRHIRSKVIGTSTQPRLVVFRSLKQTYCQLVIDVEQKTLTGLSTMHLNIVSQKLQGKIAKSKALGIEIANRAKELGIKQVVFDRNGYPYHGRIAAVAEGAREGGLSL